MGERVSAMETTLGHHTDKLEKLDKDVVRIHARIDDVHKDIGSMASRMNDRFAEQESSLESVVAELEKRIRHDLDQMRSEMKSDLADHERGETKYAEAKFEGIINAIKANDVASQQRSKLHAQELESLKASNKLLFYVAVVGGGTVFLSVVGFLLRYHVEINNFLNMLGSIGGVR